ncbi:hypothetical protein C8R45DRAFT_1109073 [Mycena sanguinolenta]|nr:hypothetical protein C8R45DRAFT_1109073 [Mycena sanguinolenta]
MSPFFGAWDLHCSSWDEGSSRDVCESEALWLVCDVDAPTFAMAAGRSGILPLAQSLRIAFPSSVPLSIPFVTQATNTKNIRLVFAAVKETILQNALKDSGIL